MKVRFLIIFIAAMGTVLIASIFTTYSSIRDSQKSFESLLDKIEEMNPDNPKIRQQITFNRVFAENQAIETTRRVWGSFLLEVLVILGVFLYYIFGVTVPIQKLSSAVKSVYFDRSAAAILMKETGTEDVRTLVRAFNEMLSKLKNYEEILGNVSKYRGWKEISRIIVHEINNIISPIQTYAEFLMEKTAEQEKVGFILNKLTDIRAVLQKFRDISHMPDAVLESRDIVPVVREISREFKNVNYVTPTEAEVPVKIDIVLFKEIIRNLVKNATEAGENVCVKTGILQRNHEVAVFVEDNGKGITAETLAKIFEPGFSTKKGKGNIGIGLSVVKSLAEEQNARVTVESETGKGSRFEVVFPAPQKMRKS